MFYPILNILVYRIVYLILRYFYKRKVRLEGKEKSLESKIKFFTDLSYNFVIKAHENHFLIICLSFLL
jgi:hypothetical protein